jgi:uncharacterized protein (TIGR02117 family)
MKILRPLFKTVLALLIFIALYALAAFTLPHIHVNTTTVNSSKPIRIFVISNGVHTDIAVPAVSPYKDWTPEFPRDTFQATNSVLSYISFGWGDKGFYLNTKTWDDLTFSTAFKAAFGLSSSLMHVRYRKEPKVVKGSRVELFIDEDSYKKLITCIENSFEKNNGQFTLVGPRDYDGNDRFYEAKGTYSLFNTCNSWTTGTLKETGLEVACWSPFAGGLIGSLEP